MPRSKSVVSWGIFDVQRGIFDVDWGISDVQQGSNEVHRDSNKVQRGGNKVHQATLRVNLARSLTENLATNVGSRSGSERLPVIPLPESQSKTDAMSRTSTDSLTLRSR